jgi:hypothetical protein
MESSRNGKTDSTRHIAIIENCTMSAVGLQHLFAMPGLSHYQLHLFSEFDSFKKALHHVNFFSLIYSFPMREKSVVTAWRTCGICVYAWPYPAHYTGI